jgi:hypothetical protein
VGRDRTDVHARGRPAASITQRRRRSSTNGSTTTSTGVVAGAASSSTGAITSAMGAAGSARPLLSTQDVAVAPPSSGVAGGGTGCSLGGRSQSGGHAGPHGPRSSLLYLLLLSVVVFIACYAHYWFVPRAIAWVADHADQSLKNGLLFPFFTIRITFDVALFRE